MIAFSHSLFTRCRTFALCAVPILFGLFWVVPVSGQGVVPVEEQIVSVRCHMLSLGPAIQNLSLPGAIGGRTSGLAVSNLSPGTPLHYHGPRLMRFYQGVESAVNADTETGEGAAAGAPASASPDFVLPPPYAEILLPADTPVVLLLFIPDSGNGKAQVAVLPFDNNQFAAGGYMFQNFTPEPIVVNIGRKKTISLRPMTSDIYQHKGGNTREEGMVRMARFNGEGRPEQFYSSRWTHIPERRTWVFLLPGKIEGSVNVRRFYDVPSR